MTRSRKLLVVCLLLVFALCLTCIAACTKTDPTTEDEQKKGFSVVVAPYDASQGTVFVSAPAEGDLYDQGETVTITVTPANGFEVTSFVVDGNDVQSVGAAGGTYTFQIAANVTVTVTFGSIPDNQVTLATGTVGEGASVIFDPQPVDGKLEKGTSVTVTVTVDADYELVSVKRNSAEEELTGDSFTFDIQENTVIDVETRVTPIKQVLDALRGAVRFEGSLEEVVDESETYDSTIVNVFDPERNAVWLQELMDGALFTDNVIGKDNAGNAIRYSHNYADGKVVKSVLYDNSGDPIDYNTYFANACDALVAADLTSSDDGVTWTFVDAAKAKAVANSVTGYDFDVASFTITLVDGEVTLDIVSETFVLEDYYGYEYNVDLTFGLTASHEDTVIPQERFEDYPDVPELAAALSKAAAEGNYTATYTQTNVPLDFVEEGTTTYAAYRTDKAVWVDNPEDPSGYVLRPDGKVWEFFMGDDYMWLGDDPFADSLDDISCAFDLGGISPSMFVLDEDGNYVLREADVLYYSDRDMNLYSIAAQSFTLGQGDMFHDASRAVSFSISVQDGTIQSVFYHGYYEQDDHVFDNFDVDIVYDNFGTTELPDGVTLDNELINGTIDPDYVGVWVNDDKTTRIDISLNGIVIDYYTYIAPDAVTPLPDGGYTLTFEEGELTIVRDGDNLVVTGLGGEIRLRRQLCEWEELLGTFSVHLYEYGVPTKVSIEITVNSVILTIGDQSVTYKELLWDSGYIYIDNYSVSIYAVDLDNNVIKYYDFEDYSSVNLYREGVELDLSGYVGTFVASDEYSFGNQVVITEDSITVRIAGIKGDNIASDVFMGRYMSDDGEEFIDIYFIVEGLVFHIQPLSKDKILLFDDLEDYFPDDAALLISETYVEDYSAFYGEYRDVGEDGVTVKIEEGKITITSGDAPATVVEQFHFYDVEYDTPRFSWTDSDGIVHVIAQFGGDPSYINYYAYDPDSYDPYSETIEITFDYYLEKDGHVSDFSDIEGVYYGNDGEDDYRLEVTSNEFKLYQNDELVPFTGFMYVGITSGGETMYTALFTLNGSNYYIMPYSMMEGRIVQLEVSVATDYGRMQLFLLNLDLSRDETDMSVYAGTYEGEGFKAVITDTTLTFYVGDQETELTDMHFVSYYDYDINDKLYKYTFSIDGVDYTMQAVDELNCMLLSSSDGKIYVLISSEYSHVDEYYGYNGYFETEDGKYAIEITDTVAISVDGAEQQVEVLYFGYDAGLVVTFGGKTYHIGLGYDEERDERCLMLLDNDAVNVTLYRIGKPIDDWTDYYGNYEGLAEDLEYGAEIGDGVFNVTIKGETTAAKNIVLRHDDDEDIDIFYFTLNGEPYRLRMEYDGEALVISADGETSCWLEKARESDAWKQFFGVWEGKDGQTTYRIEMNADESKLFVDGEEQTAIFTFGGGNSFDVNWNGSSFQLVYHADGPYLNIFDVGSTVNVDLYPVQVCEWLDAVGTYSSEEGSVVINEDSIVVSIGAVNFTVNAADIDYSYRTPEDEDPYHRFFFTVNGTDYSIEVYSALGFLTIEDDGDLYERLDRPKECAWTEYIGTWSAQDEFLYTVVISADGIHITYDDVDYTVDAENITFDPETGFSWIYDAVNYYLDISDEDLVFHDEDYELLIGFNLSRVE